MQHTATSRPGSRPIRRLASTSLLLACLAACGADGGLYQPQDVPPGLPDYPLAEGPELTIELGLPQPEAQLFVEEVAARCWLDGVLRADAMVVDRASGRIVMTGETDDLLIVDFIPRGTPQSLAAMRLSGAAVTNEEQTRRLIEHLERAERTGEVACPALDLNAPVVQQPA
ncbi:MAG: hypothetical protein AAFY66_05410 [Pseudomonadota bacterium]